VRLAFSITVCGLVPASDVYWLIDFQSKATCSPRPRRLMDSWPLLFVAILAECASSSSGADVTEGRLMG
jgi:hypothetical protein